MNCCGHNTSLTMHDLLAIAVLIQMRYNIISQGVGARQCRALTGVRHACREML